VTNLMFKHQNAGKLLLNAFPSQQLLAVRLKRSRCTIPDVTRRIWSLDELRLLGGAVCLDFANTVEPREGAATRHDYLRSYGDLVAWSAHAGLIDHAGAAKLREQAAAHSGRAERVHSHALRLREAIYRTFAAVSRQHAPAQADLDAIADVYRHALRHAQLAAGGTAVAWRAAAAGPPLETVLLPITQSAVEVLTRPPDGRIKQCPGAGDCGWLFLDRSKNGSRRWCRADGCGARVKMQRYYWRTQAQAASAQRPQV
jgi:predicted RNA-binding Zn ribbon-like protein